MNSNQKKFGIYVFLSTFSRNLIEVFIPVILYKFGYTIKEVLLYYLIANVTSLILTYPFVFLSKKFNNKILAIIGIIAFVLVQISLNFLTYSYMYLFTIAVFYAIYRRGYWISRRYYNLKIIKNYNISKTYSIISIINQVGVIISAYFGSLILDYISLKLLTIFAIVLFILSIVPLYTLKFEHEKTNVKLELINNVRKIPKSNIYLFGSYELINIVKFLIPLYIFIYVKDKYQVIGIVNLITNFALITFTYLYGKKLDNSNNNFLKLAIFLTVLIYILKVNSNGLNLLIISFIEGIIIKMYELSINKEFYTFSKKFEYYNYNLIYELTQNFFRSVVTLLLFVINIDIKLMVYITLGFVFIGIFLKFQYNKNEIKTL